MRKVTGRVTFHIYGAMYDEAYWARCREAIGRLPANVEVVWKGTVPPEQVHQVLAEHHALFMPSAGENFGHTMLESLCAGRPLLISDRTPWRNLEADHAGWDLPLDRPGAFSEAVESMCAMEQAEYNAWSAGASERGKRYLADEGPVEASLKLFQP